MWRLVLALVVAASCGGSDSVTATTAGAEVGTYALITVDGRPLPACSTPRPRAWTEAASRIS